MASLPCSQVPHSPFLSLSLSLTLSDTHSPHSSHECRPQASFLGFTELKAAHGL